MTRPTDHAAPLIGQNDELPANAKRVYLVRHVQAHSWGVPCAMDPDLNAFGEAQLEAVREHCAQLTVDVIITSELLRAQRTARALQRAAHCELLIDPEWNEFHAVGRWRDHSLEETQRQALGRVYRPDQRAGGGESLRELHRRSRSAWERLLQLPARNVLLVGHNAVLGTLLSWLFGLPESADRAAMIAYPHGAVSELWSLDTSAEPDLPDRVTMLRYLCYAEHLKPHLLSY